MKNLIQCAFFTLALLLGLNVSAQQSNNLKDSSIGIILDLQGSVKLLEQAPGRKLQLLSYLKPNDQIQIEEGSKLSISLYSNRAVYRFVGPSLILAEKDQIKVLKGTAPEVRQVKEKLSTGGSPEQLITGAIRMRQLAPKIAVLSPENGAVLLQAPKDLNWAAVEKASYELRIVDEDENLIVETSLNGNSWPIPNQLKWLPGKAYKWSVSFISERDGGRYMSSGEFRIADDALRAELAKLKPADDAVIEEWVLYAAFLQSKAMYQEARDTWKRIGKLRPDLERIRDAN